LSATIRRDGSSKFQDKNKWGNFPSASIGWRASEESFIRNLNVFDQLKVRVSYGVTGNQAIGPYSTLGLLHRANYGWGSSSNYPGYWAQNLPTPDLTWEKTYQYDIGLDMGFFNNRLRATVDFYQKDTKDLLLRKAIPYYNGGGSVYKNLGHVKNRGYDINLGFDPVQTKNVKWSSNFNISYSKNEVIDMGGDERLFVGARNNTIGFQPYVLEVGKPMGSLWGYTWLGLWKTDEATEAAKYGQHPGDNHFLDVNNDNIINSDDQSVIGKAFPDYTLGWNNTVSIKNFDFNLFFQGSFGADRLNLTRYTMSEATSDAKFITSKEGYYNMWTPDNQETNIPNIYSVTINTQGGSTQYLESANYVRLKNFSVAYNIPFKNTSQISNFRISCSAQNVFTITNYSGYDPEVTGSVSDIQNGIEFGAYPLARTFTLGLQLTF
jgi:TonB-linked SusC/RagA family outer membrane protein